ncbi:MAG: helix-turn-helix domain-containing protein [Bryobacteraceae bacterium]
MADDPEGLHARSRVVLELLESPRLSRLSLQDFAARCAVSVGWLRKWLKRLAGDSFPSLVRRARLTRASNLLRAREVRVADAAACAGYADDHHFYRDFKKLLGVTPDGYRTHWKRTHCPHCPLAARGESRFPKILTVANLANR